jgi:hypothetical protein
LIVEPARITVRQAEEEIEVGKEGEPHHEPEGPPNPAGGGGLPFLGAGGEDLMEAVSGREVGYR